MSAEILRRAAALMRERAEAATSGPWEVAFTYHVVRDSGRHNCGTGPEGHFGAHEPGCGLDEIARTSDTDAEHIASWHPAVALAVAEWLEWCAEPIDALILPSDAPLYVRALAVARAYLGSES